MTRRPERARSGNGFTLIELVITVAIVGILALGLLPLTQLAVQRAKESELRGALRDIRTAIDEYKKAADRKRIAKSVDESGYPPSLEVLVEGVPDMTSPNERMIYFMRRIPRDPFFEDDTVPAAATWGLRSYQSPPDNPYQGDDVFDVYSRSDGVGLNGVPYREW
jgi:general secretion pathway protein G